MILGEFFFENFGEFCSFKLVHYRAPALQRKRMRVGNLGVYTATYTAISGAEKSPFLDRVVLAAAAGWTVAVALTGAAALAEATPAADHGETQGCDARAGDSR